MMVERASLSNEVGGERIYTLRWYPERRRATVLMSSSPNFSSAVGRDGLRLTVSPYRFALASSLISNVPSWPSTVWKSFVSQVFASALPRR